jgi:hypothetical protein
MSRYHRATEGRVLVIPVRGRAESAAGHFVAFQAVAAMHAEGIALQDNR